MLSKLLSVIFIILFSPILIIVAIGILLDDGLPILFKQKRIGLNNSYFWIYKFRTMRKDTPDIATHLLNDSQSLYTMIGPFIRKYSIDELPQLINIIKGDMNFVGPRPSLHNQDDLNKLRTKVGVHTLIPGVTGWAQVNGRDELSISEKVEMDLFYKNNKSFSLDFKILFLTILKVFKADNIYI
tara:strand:+ start:93 stop:644 length:552 start_codon:yes stop_codon:yes gene_type:complete